MYYIIYENLELVHKTTALNMEEIEDAERELITIFKVDEEDTYRLINNEWIQIDFKD